MKRLFALTILVVAFSTHGSYAEDKVIENVGITENSLLKEMGIDMAVPTSPAFAVLGLTPETVIRPTSPRNLVVSILTGNDPKGNGQNGFALEFNPYLLLAGDSLSIADYRYGSELDSKSATKPPRSAADWTNLTRLSSRVGISAAIARGSGDDDADRGAVGITLTPLDLGDPRLDFELSDCFLRRGTPIHRKANEFWTKNNGVAKILEAGGDEGKEKKILDEFLKPLKEEIRPIHQKCREEAAARNWNATAWNIGFASTWINRPDRSEGYEFSGLAVWSTFSYGFEGSKALKDTSQILAHVKYRTKEMVPHPTAAGSFIEQDTFTAALQIRVNGPTFKTGSITKVGGPDLNFSFEGAYVLENRDTLKNEETLRYTLSAEYKIQEDLYFKLSAGTETGRDVGDNNSFVTGNIKWAFGGEPSK